MYCNNCKNNVPDGKFCVYCGNEITKNKKQKGKIISIIYSILILMASCICLIVAIALPILTVKELSAHDTSGGAVSGIPIITGAFANLIYIPLMMSIDVGCIIWIKKSKSNLTRTIICFLAIILIAVFLLVFHWLHIDYLFFGGTF